MGGDRNTARSAGVAPYFNPRLPDGRRPLTTRQTIPPTTFQSTPPGWEATHVVCGHFGAIPDFNPRLPDGRRRHASFIPLSSSRFQSTPPGWEATVLFFEDVKRVLISIHASRMGGDHRVLAIQRAPDISIHASRMGGDLPYIQQLASVLDFNPRLPDGRRQQLNDATCNAIQFQSTPPGWEATRVSPARLRPKSFQSTPPGWEATRCPSRGQAPNRNFNPRLPDGRRLINTVNQMIVAIFQSTPPGWEATATVSAYSPTP